MTHEAPTLQTLEVDQGHVPHVRSSELVRVGGNSYGRVFPDSDPPISAISSFVLSKISSTTDAVLVSWRGEFTGPTLRDNYYRLGLWRQSCDRILAPLEEFSRNLLENIGTFRKQGDDSGVDIIGSSCIACLAHLAVLYEVVGRMDPAAMDKYNLCYLAV